MKYIVVGSGPTGLSLTYYLAKGGHEVTLIEKEDQLGGSWNSQWHDDKYFTENSPRVLIFSQLTRKFLGDLGLDKQDFADGQCKASRAVAHRVLHVGRAVWRPMACSER